MIAPEEAGRLRRGPDPKDAMIGALCADVDAAHREAQRARMAATVVMALLILAVVAAGACVLANALAPLLEAAP